MKKTLSLGVVLSIAALALSASAQDTMKKSSDSKAAKTKSEGQMKKEKAPPAKPMTKKNAFTPGEMQWSAAPPIIPAGAQMSVLDGNPMGEDVYTIRLKMPSGYKVAPHWHPKREEVTVISGTLNVGMGDKFDAAAMKAFPAGSFAYLDPDMHHYVQTKGATEIQIHGRGPVQFNYVDPNDDPSKKK